MTCLLPPLVSIKAANNFSKKTLNQEHPAAGLLTPPDVLLLAGAVVATSVQVSLQGETKKKKTSYGSLPSNQVFQAQEN